MIVDIGCGPNKRDRADVGVDIRDYNDVDIVADLEDGLPLDSNSADGILAYHVLEHVDDLPGVMDELHRVLAHGGYLEGKVPHYRESDAHTDPTHRQYFTAETFHYWDPTTDYGRMEYFDAEFRIETCRRVRRVQFWKGRPVEFRLRAVKE